MAIDPSDHHRGKTIKTGYNAHVNLNLIHGSTLWQGTFTDWNHNHPQEIPPGGTIVQRPTTAQRQVISKLATNHPLEPKQVSNIINDARHQAREDVQALGGDIAAIIVVLQGRIDDGECWQYKLQLDENQVVIGLWWLSPTQLDLAQCFSDVLINDNTYNHNQYNYPFNIGIIIDNFGASQNAWYAFQATEDVELHCWIFQCHLEAVWQPPEVFFPIDMVHLSQWHPRQYLSHVTYTVFIISLEISRKIFVLSLVLSGRISCMTFGLYIEQYHPSSSRGYGPTSKQSSPGLIIILKKSMAAESVGPGPG
ncbi:hypothetical protein BDR07DRAFT_1493700 [Suillus spraguei]|nr:hypothetical protein BDR07DRAFT_1493700 [Suillus spraguei]